MPGRRYVRRGSPRLSLRKRRPGMGQTHRDSPLSTRGRLIWWGVLAGILLAGIALFVLGGR
jgi:hypothetical protein